MGKLKSLAVLVALGANGSGLMAAPWSDVPASAGRPQPPVPPVEYVKAGAKLFNSGDSQKAAQYLKAANDYRDMLSADEQTVLDSYLNRLNAPAKVDAAVAKTSAEAPAASTPVASATRGTADLKQKSRWLLKSAREDLRQGHYDEAATKVAEARTLNVDYTLFDDTPDRVEEALTKARPKVASAAAGPKDKKAAKDRLKEARRLINAGQFDQAEALALDVDSWKLDFGMFEDSPKKVISATRAVKQRDKLRQAGTKGQVNLGIYDALLQESRELAKAGKLAEAEAKARQAMALNVAPPLDSPRAEDILHEISLAKAAGKPTADPAVARVAAEEPVALVAPGDAPAPAPAPADLTPPTPPVADAPVSNEIAKLAQANDAKPANPGEQMLEQAKSLLASGNFEAAKAAAEKAKAGNFGVEAQANDLIAQIGLSTQNGSIAMYEAALDALRKGDNGRAKALLTEISSVPGVDDGMNQKVQDLLLKLSSDEKGAKAEAAKPTDMNLVAAQKLNAEVGTKVAEARRHLETDPGKSIALLEETLKLVKAAEAPEAVKRAMTRRVEVAIELARKEKATFDVKMTDANARAEIERKRLRILEADNAKRSEVDALMKQSSEAYNNGKLEEAEMFAKRAVEIDPNSLAATAMSWKARTERHYKRSMTNEANKEEGFLAAMHGVDEAMVVDPAVSERGIAFPKDFKDLTINRRELMARLEPRKDAKTIAIEKKMTDEVTINFDKQPITEAVSFLENYTGLNIEIDPKALAEEGFTPETPVSLSVNKIKLRKALELLLRPLNLTYTIDDEVILITSPQSGAAKTYSKIYYVGDLVKPANSEMDPAATSPEGMMPAGMDPTNAGFKSEPALNSGFTTLKGARPQADISPLIMMITTSIAPGSWKVVDPSTQKDISGAYGLGFQGPGGMGGGLGGGGGAADLEGLTLPVGSIYPYFLTLSLIVRHTNEVHDEISDLLKQLRRMQDIQVTIEARFITLRDTFAEAIGVDFDFQIQSDAYQAGQGYIQQQADPFYAAGSSSSGTTGGGGGTGASGGTALPYLVNSYLDHSLPNRQPVALGVGGAGSAGGMPPFTSNLAIPFINNSYPTSTVSGFNQGASFGISFLSDLETYLFVNAAQTDQRSNIVQAPKVTTFNGSAAYIASTQMVPYVSNYVPVVGPGSVAYQPVVSQLPDGVQLRVTPVVTHDRRYVRLSINPIFISQKGNVTIPLAGGAVGGGGLGGGASTTAPTNLVLPTYTQFTVATVVTVPDGGTVLLGGVKLMNESRAEAGVPILSKTPYINRLFRNIGITRDTNSLMIMVTPRIIMLEEEEEKLGIPTISL